MMIQDTKTMAAPNGLRTLYNRRENERHHGAGMLVEHDGRSYAVSDVSVGGLKVMGLSAQIDDRLRLVLMTDNSGRVAADCRVVDVKDGKCRMAFTRPTLPLLRLIIAHIAVMTGTSPHLLKPV